MAALTSNKLSRYLIATVAFVLLLSEPPLSSSNIEGSAPAVYLSIHLSIYLSIFAHTSPQFCRTLSANAAFLYLALF